MLTGEITSLNLCPEDLLRDLLSFFLCGRWMHLHALVTAAPTAPDADHGYRVQQGGLDGDAVAAVHVFFQIDADQVSVHARIVLHLSQAAELSTSPTRQIPS